MKKPILFFSIRLLLGMMYIISGTEKLLSPKENFVFIIQAYDIVHNSYLENLAASIFPWIEYLVGCFLVIGLWVKFGFLVIGLFSAVFIVVVGQAILRNLPLESCGCFGDLVHIPIQVTFVIDVMTLVFVIWALYNLQSALFMSLDKFFQEK